MPRTVAYVILFERRETVSKTVPVISSNLGFLIKANRENITKKKKTNIVKVLFPPLKKGDD